MSGSSKDRDLERINLLAQSVILTRGVPGSRIRFTHVQGFEVVLREPEMTINHQKITITGETGMSNRESFDIWEIKGSTLHIIEI